jgi:hypothetical protein
VSYSADEKLGHCGIYLSDKTAPEVQRFLEEITKSYAVS